MSKTRKGGPGYQYIGWVAPRVARRDPTVSLPEVGDILRTQCKGRDSISGGGRPKYGPRLIEAVQLSRIVEVEVGGLSNELSHVRVAHGRVRDENRRMIDVLDRDINMTEERMQKPM